MASHEGYRQYSEPIKTSFPALHFSEVKRAKTCTGKLARENLRERLATSFDFTADWMLVAPQIVGETKRPWQTRTHCCGHIVAHHDSWAAQTGKHLLRTQNVSEQNQKHFFMSATNVALSGKRGNICVGNNVSATMCPRLPGPQQIAD